MTKGKIKNFGFDIDGVFCDIVKSVKMFLLYKYNYELDINKVTNYKIEECIKDIEKEKIIDAVFKSIEIPIFMKPLKHSVLFLYKYYKLTNKPIIFITNRPEKYKECTEIWVMKYMPNIPFKIWYSKDKTKTIKEENIECFVEDNPENAMYIASLGTKVYLFNHPWNQNKHLDKHENIVRLSYHWKSLDSILFNNKQVENLQQIKITNVKRKMEEAEYGR